MVGHLGRYRSHLLLPDLGPGYNWHHDSLSADPNQRTLANLQLVLCLVSSCLHRPNQPSATLVNICWRNDNLLHRLDCPFREVCDNQRYRNRKGSPCIYFPVQRFLRHWVLSYDLCISDRNLTVYAESSRTYDLHCYD
jgi:hypothetical protein